MVKRADRTPVGAHYGWQDWLAQRITAVIMVLFSIVFLGFFLIKGSVGYAEWHSLFHSQLFRILAALGAGARRCDLVDFLKEKGYYEYANTNLNAIMVKRDFWFI